MFDEALLGFLPYSHIDKVTNRAIEELNMTFHSLNKLYIYLTNGLSNEVSLM